MYMYKIVFVLLCFSQIACAQNNSKTAQINPSMSNKNNPYYKKNQQETVVVPDSVWKQILPADVYEIARLKGTERPFTSKYETSKEIGTY